MTPQTKQYRKKNNLSRRISTRIIVPLLLLTAVFTALQLTNQMNAMNEYYTIESRLAFDSLHKHLADLMVNETALQDPDNLRSSLNKLAEEFRTDPIYIYDLLERKPLFEEEAGMWRETDFQAMEKSLYQKQLGKLYMVQVDKEEKKLIAFIPFSTAPESHLWVAKVIFPLAHIRDALLSSVWTLGFMIFLILFAGFMIAQGLARSIVNPIKTLNDATQEIVKGHLGKHVKITTGDEIEELAHTFNHMSESLKSMRQRAEDSNPLTQLPGNHGIFYELNRRIQERQKFVCFHIDLDRFKIFNDNYGLARGDEVLKKTATILKEVAQSLGSKDDFVGHQGGDDYLMIVKPQKAKEIAEEVIRQFDEKVVKTVYRKDDFERGYILGIDRRQGEPEEGADADDSKKVKFPLMAISLAGVSNTKKDFADYFDCLSRAVPVKKDVKKIIQSAYIIQE